jgi:glutamate-5-semialdehyde dehydrogenase
MLSDQSNQTETSVEPIESAGVEEVVALIPIPEYVNELVTRAKQAAARLATLSTVVKNRALLAMAEALEAQQEALLAANELDLEAFGTEPEKKAMADRLRLTAERIVEMATGLREVAALPDPLGAMPKMRTRPNGMQVGRVRVPIGVIGIIYESRPNVTADSAALCLKSGNACVLRGGSEAIHSNTAIATVLSEAAEKAGVPAGAISFVARPDRELVPLLLKQDRYIDLIIPRGGESLMRVVTEHATVPVIKHDAGGMAETPKQHVIPVLAKIAFTVHTSFFFCNAVVNDNLIIVIPRLAAVI